MAEISTIQFKRGTKAVLETKLVGDKKPLKGEPVFEIDTNKLKIGDGENDYKDLPYIAGGSTEEQIIFSSHYEFPAIGEEDKLYVAKDENKSYLWKNTKYVIVAANESEIDGGGADAQY